MDGRLVERVVASSAGCAVTETGTGPTTVVNRWKSYNNHLGMVIPSAGSIAEPGVAGAVAVGVPAAGKDHLDVGTQSTDGTTSFCCDRSQRGERGSVYKVLFPNYGLWYGINSTRGKKKITEKEKKLDDVEKRRAIFDHLIWALNITALRSLNSVQN